MSGATTATDSIPHIRSRFEDFAVGDQVWCLAWIGMPFEVVAKDPDTEIVSIDGSARCSLPEGARLDLLPQNHYLLTKEHWDQIWYWPDLKGEQYLDVVHWFIDTHHEGELVSGYAAGAVSVDPKPRGATTYRLSFEEWLPFNQLKAQPLVAVADDRTIITEFDPAIPVERWQPSGPRVALEIEMIGYRWAITHGRQVLNWTDF